MIGSSAFPWAEVLLPATSWLEKTVRPFFVYLTLLVIFRVIAKRGMAQATLFDFLIILLISNVVQNAMIGNDNSIAGAALGAVTLVAISGMFNRLTARRRRLRSFLEGEPVLLVERGAIDATMMVKMAVSRNDLLAAIRRQGIVRLRDVAFAVLELDGTISVIRASDAEGGEHDCLPVEIAGGESADASADDQVRGQGRHKH